MVSDPIADMLVRIKNGLRTHREHVEIPVSKFKIRLAEILEKEQFIEKFMALDDGRHGVLRVFLRYGPAKEPVIQEMRRISRPGRRVYLGHLDMPRIKRGYGIGIYSTSRGLVTDGEARKMKVGGEYLCEVW